MHVRIVKGAFVAIVKTIFSALSVAALACAIALAAPASADAAAKLPAPAWPHVKHSGWHGLKVSWKAVDGADGYAVYRWSKAKGKYVRRAWTKKTAWRDTGLKSDRKYRYKVAAYTKAKGKKRVGKRSYWVAAVAYSKGAKTVNPGKPKVKKLASSLMIGEQRTAEGAVKVSVYGKRAGGKKAKPFSESIRVVSGNVSVISCCADDYLAVGVGSCKMRLVAANGAMSSPVKARVSHNPAPGWFSDPKNSLCPLYDPEVIDFLNANADGLHSITERLYTKWDKHPGWKVEKGVGGELSFPEWMGESDRDAIATLFEWEGFDESIYLRTLFFNDSLHSQASDKAHYTLSFYSAIQESTLSGYPYVTVSGPLPKSRLDLAHGWRLDPAPEVDE